MRRLRDALRRLRRGWRPGRGGFTLPEIIIVMAILAIGIIPLAAVQSGARQQVSRSGRHSQAALLAQTRIEEAKALGFGNIAAGEGTEGTLSWNRAVTTVSFGLQRVDVTVNWTEGRSNATLTMAALVSMR